MKDHFTEKAHEEHVTDALMKFFMLLKKPVVISDFTKDPNLREFLKRVHQYGVPSSLLMGETLVVKKSLVNIEDVVDKYKSEVMSSWKTTGCTLISYNAKAMKYTSSIPDKDNFPVLGFYSPKGFIFFEGPGSYINIKRHLPSVDIENVTIHLMKHNCIMGCDGDFSSCEFKDMDIFLGLESYYETRCICHELQDICIDVCKELEWVQRLIKKAEDIHHCLVDKSSELRKYYYTALKERDFKGFADEIHARPLSCFLAIMLLQGDALENLLVTRLIQVPLKDTEIKERVRAENKAFLDDSELWNHGSTLYHILTLILKGVTDIMDTFVPTVGYLLRVLDNVINEESVSVEDIPGFRQALYITLNEKYAYAYPPACLNPLYFKPPEYRGGEEDEDDYIDEIRKLNLKEALKESWQNFKRGQEHEFELEVERYISELSNPRSKFCKPEICHPVKLWEKYGGDYPLLQKYAIEVLSKPVSCMCNQVKKHIVQLEGTDDYILRLNLRMMEEYKNLGDDIYKHIDCNIDSLDY